MPQPLSPGRVVLVPIVRRNHLGETAPVEARPARVIQAFNDGQIGNLAIDLDPFNDTDAILPAGAIRTSPQSAAVPSARLVDATEALQAGTAEPGGGVPAICYWPPHTGPRPLAQPAPGLATK